MFDWHIVYYLSSTKTSISHAILPGRALLAIALRAPKKSLFWGKVFNYMFDWHIVYYLSSTKTSISHAILPGRALLAIALRAGKPASSPKRSRINSEPPFTT